MSNEEKESSLKWSGEREDFEVFLVKLEAFESEHGCDRATAVDKGEDLILRSENVSGTKKVMQANGTYSDEPVVQEDRTLYKLNAKSYNKIMKALPNNLIKAAKNTASLLTSSTDYFLLPFSLN